MHKITLFEARTGGYWNYRVPGILCMPRPRGARGVVLATAEARRGRGGDWDGNDVLLRRSLDGGRTWEPPQVVVACEQYGPGPVSNFVMIGGGDTVHALYCHNYARVFYMRSTDDGESFSAPVEITAALEPFREVYPWRVIATGPGHGIQLARQPARGPHRGTRCARLIVPVWMSDGSGKEFGLGKLGHRPSSVASIYSDDGGQTWQCGEFVAHTGERVVNPSETLPVELDDGRVLFNLRSESRRNRRLVSVSPDGAHDWSQPRFDDALLEPVCMASLLRLRQRAATGESVYLFANPDNLENELTPAGGNLAHDRKRLTVKMSADECRTWPYARVIEPGPSGYSDLAETPDAAILCIYECGMLERMTDTRSLTVARFDLDWVMGADGGPVKKRRSM
jgi:sialidase-1